MVMVPLTNHCSITIKQKNVSGVQVLKCQFKMEVDVLMPKLLSLTVLHS